MIWEQPVTTLLWCVVAALFVWAAVRDALSYTIPNTVSAALLALYPGHILLTWPDTTWLIALAIAAAVFLLGFLAFSAGIVGGGDVKLLCVLCLWAGPSDLLATIFVVALSGGLTALGILTFLTIKSFRVKLVPDLATIARMARETPVPYGVAISFGGVYLTVTKILA